MDSFIYYSLWKQYDNSVSIIAWQFGVCWDFEDPVVLDWVMWSVLHHPHDLLEHFQICILLNLCVLPGVLSAPHPPNFSLLLLLFVSPNGVKAHSQLTLSLSTYWCLHLPLCLHPIINLSLLFTSPRVRSPFISCALLIPEKELSGYKFHRFSQCTFSPAPVLSPNLLFHWHFGSLHKLCISNSVLSFCSFSSVKAPVNKYV